VGGVLRLWPSSAFLPSGAQAMAGKTQRLVRIALWLLAAFCAWAWFSTSHAPEQPVKDGLDSVLEGR
jgi:hypothetical protein